MNYNEVYVINQPEHTILSIIVMDTKFPLTEVSHSYIEKLQKFSDTCFLFSDKLFESKNVNKKKFTSLYDGNCFISAQGNSILPMVLKALNYSIEIFKKHNSFLIFNLSDFEKYSEEEFGKFRENTIKINSSGVMHPILRIKKLNNEELFEYYNEETRDYNEQSGNRFLDFFASGSSYIGKKLCLNYFTESFASKDVPENNKNIYSSWKTNSIVQFFKRDTILKFIDFLENNPGFIDTFEGWGIDMIFSTLVRRLKLKNHNNGIEELDLGEKI